jgi:lipid II:glycine glycyltransferase (peptidoglycan interpeptide bridge formation enzyme)
MDLDLPSGRGEDEVFGSFGTTTRQLIRTAERRGLRTVLLDPGSTWPLEQPFESASVDEGTAPEALLQAFYVMLQGTARRVGFGVAPRDQFLDWSSRALAAGHMLYLQAVDEEDEIVAGATFYRHGERLTYALAGDRADLRRKHPGAVRLLLWRGIQLALREGRRTVDLGGVDVRGARDKPEPGDATHGLLGFKQSFGAHWVELAGAHERVVNPVRYAAGRVAARLARVGR